MSAGGSKRRKATDTAVRVVDVFEATFRVLRFIMEPARGSGYCVAVVRLVDPPEEALCVEKTAMNEMWGDESRRKRKRAAPPQLEWEDMGIKFIGNVNSAAPYMWHKGTFTVMRESSDVSKYPPRLVVRPASGSTVLCVKPAKLSLRHCYWILVHESQCRDEVAAGTLVRDQIKRGVIRTEEEGRRLYIDMEQFQQEPFYRSVFKDSDLYRMEYQSAAIHVFGAEKTQAIMEKTPEQLEQLHSTLSTQPWTLCFYHNCGNTYRGLGELDWLGLRRAMVQFKLAELPVHIGVALRFYSASINVWRELTKNTLFRLQEMKQYHVSVAQREADWRSPKDVVPVLREFGQSDGRYLDKAVEWLTGAEADALHVFPDGTACLKKDLFKSRKIIKWLSEIARNDNLAVLRPGNAVPCRPRGALDEEQLEAMRRLIRGDPLVMVSGPPGTGKTAVIECAFGRFKNVLVLCSHGTMSRELCRRFAGGTGNEFRADTAFTIDHIDTLHFWTPSAKDWLQRFDLVIVDEASNMDQDHLFKLLRATRRHPGETRDKGARQLLLVFDHNQQRPIGVGEPVMALTDTFPELLVTLTQQHRTEAAGKAISAAAVTMLSRGPRYVLFTEMPEPAGDRIGHFKGALSKALRDPLVHVDSLVCERFCPRPVQGNPRDVCQPHVLPMLVEQMARAAGGIEKWREWQFITFRKEDSDRISLAVLHHLRQGPLKKTDFVAIPRSNTDKYMPRGLLLAPGVKIVFRKTFKGLWDPTKNARTWPEVRNGQICVVDHVDPGGSYATLDDGRRICLDSNQHVDPRYIRYAYCITSYSAQGLGCGAVCVCLHEQTRNAAWPARDSVYTALTRAKRMAIMYGRRQDFDTFSSRLPPTRSTVLRKLMAENAALRDVLRPGGGRSLRVNPPPVRDPTTLWVVPLDAQCTVSMEDAVLNREFEWKWDEMEEDDEDEDDDDGEPPVLPVLRNWGKRRNSVDLASMREEDERDAEDALLHDAYAVGDGFVVDDDDDA